MTEQYRVLMEVMEQRRSHRAFAECGLDRELVDKVLDAALTAPSAGNRQAFRLIVVESKSMIDRMAAAVGEVVGELAVELRGDLTADAQGYLSNFTHFSTAPVLVVPIYRTGVDLLSEMAGSAHDELQDRGGDRDAISSVAAAATNLILAAEALGLGTCWMTGPLVARARLDALLSLPKGWEIAAIVPLGYPASSPPKPPRRKRERMVRYIERGQ